MLCSLTSTLALLWHLIKDAKDAGPFQMSACSSVYQQ